MRCLDFSARISTVQVVAGRGFILEQPLTASSWSRPNIKELYDLFAEKDDNGDFITGKAQFDQCRFGRKSKEKKLPMTKPTTLMTNVETVFKAFNNKRCQGGHTHQPVEGCEGGEKRLTWAQRYPAVMVSKMASAIMDKSNFEAEED